MDIFKDRKIVVATMHAKEKVIAPLLETYLAAIVVVPKKFDSDQFGTFTRDITRDGNQLEAARKKVYAAMEQEGVDLGVSSEGSFGPHPSIMFAQSDFELVLLVDKKNNLEIIGQYRTTETNMAAQYVESVNDALDFAKRVGFPEHGVILRNNEKGRFGIHKNIQTEEMLIETMHTMLSGIFTKRVFIETDMRANRNPTRMKAIQKATEDLIKNSTSLCPQCRTPGFVSVDCEKGLECSRCHLSTDLPINDVYQCSVCNYSKKRLVTKYGEKADPQYCGYCNP